MYVRILPEDISKTISHIENVYNRFSPGLPFSYTFFDEEYDRIYRAEQRLGTILRYFTALAIFISCLGLFGLTSYMAEQRTREIGIRKVLGASDSGLVTLLSKDFLLSIAIANIIAWPAAYYFTKKWLQNFVYNAGLEPGVFILAGTATLFIALLTVSFQTIRAARAKPVEALRFE